MLCEPPFLCQMSSAIPVLRLLTCEFCDPPCPKGTMLGIVWQKALSGKAQPPQETHCSPDYILPEQMGKPRPASSHSESERASGLSTRHHSLHPPGKVLALQRLPSLNPLNMIKSLENIILLDLRLQTWLLTGTQATPTHLIASKCKGSCEVSVWPQWIEGAGCLGAVALTLALWEVLGDDSMWVFPHILNLPS